MAGRAQGAYEVLTGQCEGQVLSTLHPALPGAAPGLCSFPESVLYDQFFASLYDASMRPPQYGVCPPLGCTHADAASLRASSSWFPVLWAVEVPAGRQTRAFPKCS